MKILLALHVLSIVMLVKNTCVGFRGKFFVDILRSTINDYQISILLRKSTKSTKLIKKEGVEEVEEIDEIDYQKR